MASTKLGVLFRHVVRTLARRALVHIDGTWHPGYIFDDGSLDFKKLKFALALTALQTSDQVYNILRLLIPSDVVGFGKRRIGGGDDGAYVMVDCITASQPILSIGVGPDVSFDLALAEQGHSIVMFDHTVKSLPVEHPNFTWHRLGVAATAKAKSSLITLAEMAAMLPQTGGAPILKMDIEGAEWEVLATASRETLAQFAQISLELHDLLRLQEPEYGALVLKALENLSADFVIVHVHANNCGIFGYVGGFPMPDILEISLIRRDLAATVPSQTWYPTPFDRSNWRGGMDLPLWGFPFVPGSASLELASIRA